MHALELGRKDLSGLLVVMEGDKMASDEKLNKELKEVDMPRQKERRFDS